MKTTACDICGSVMVDKVKFNFGGSMYRYATMKQIISNGVRWKEVDICPECQTKIFFYHLDQIKK